MCAAQVLRAEAAVYDFEPTDSIVYTRTHAELCQEMELLLYGRIGHYEEVCGGTAPAPPSPLFARAWGTAPTPSPLAQVIGRIATSPGLTPHLLWADTTLTMG